MRLIYITVIMALLFGCSGHAKREARRELLRVPDRQAEERKRREAESFYDERGNLRPSTETVAGLRLPRGLTPRVKADPHWLYKTGVPLEKLHWYFGGRLITRNIRREGGAATYMDARLSEDPNSETRLDVKIGPDLPRRQENLVEIYRRPALRFQGKPPLERILEQNQYK